LWNTPTLNPELQSSGLPHQTSRVTIVLLNRHIAWLDRLTVDIRLKHGKILRRDALLHALIEASIRKKMDADSLLKLLRG
jgi:hypothetical protein